jgi:hypothetical protein
MDRDGTGLALDANAAAVQLVEADAPLLEGRGHRRDLVEVARELGKRGAKSSFRRERDIEVGDLAFRIQGGRDGTEAGSGRVCLVEIHHVARETGCASDEEHEEARGQGIEGPGVPDPGLFREQALDFGDRPCARYARRLVEQKAAR